MKWSNSEEHKRCKKRMEFIKITVDCSNYGYDEIRILILKFSIKMVVKYFKVSFFLYFLCFFIYVQVVAFITFERDSSEVFTS